MRNNTLLFSFLFLLGCVHHYSPIKMNGSDFIEVIESVEIKPGRYRLVIQMSYVMGLQNADFNYVLINAFPIKAQNLCGYKNEFDYTTEDVERITLIKNTKIDHYSWQAKIAGEVICK
ncbi:hypothetical protein [Marinicella sp. W31]|uniref:hypothetical protein n=1 Tax=Marinicella sp. W31 TaxID=3023713 RepID=UPI0037568E73